MATPKKRTSFGQKALDLAAARADVIDEVGRKSDAIERLKEKYQRDLEAAEADYVRAVADATEQWSTRELREEFDISVTKPVKEEIKRRREDSTASAKSSPETAPDTDTDSGPELASETTSDPSSDSSE